MYNVRSVSHSRHVSNFISRGGNVTLDTRNFLILDAALSVGGAMHIRSVLDDKLVV